MSNPDLIVPIRDRRSGKRILTLKNIRNAALITAGLVVTVLVVSEIRKPKATDEYGRLFGQQVAVPAAEAKPAQQIVTEGTIPDQDHADPTLLEPAAREQYLGVNSNTAAPVVPTATVEPVAPPSTTLTNTKHVSIVGDASGVAISTSTQQRQTLSGGIFKPQ